MDSRLGLLDSVVRSVKRLCEGKLCYLRHRNNVSALCLFYNNYYGVEHLMNEYLHYFIATRSTRASDSLGELDLAIPGCRTDQFCRSFLPAAGRL